MVFLVFITLTQKFWVLSDEKKIRKSIQTKKIMWIPRFFITELWVSSDITQNRPKPKKSLVSPFDHVKQIDNWDHIFMWYFLLYMNLELNVQVPWSKRRFSSSISWNFFLFVGLVVYTWTQWLLNPRICPLPSSQ